MHGLRGRRREKSEQPPRVEALRDRHGRGSNRSRCCHLLLRRRTRGRTLHRPHPPLHLLQPRAERIHQRPQVRHLRQLRAHRLPTQAPPLLRLRLRLHLHALRLPLLLLPFFFRNQLALRQPRVHRLRGAGGHALDRRTDSPVVRLPRMHAPAPAAVHTVRRLGGKRPPRAAVAAHLLHQRLAPAGALPRKLLPDAAAHAPATTAGVIRAEHARRRCAHCVLAREQLLHRQLVLGAVRARGRVRARCSGAIGGAVPISVVRAHRRAQIHLVAHSDPHPHPIRPYRQRAFVPVRLLLDGPVHLVLFRVALPSSEPAPIAVSMSAEAAAAAEPTPPALRRPLPALAPAALKLAHHPAHAPIAEAPAHRRRGRRRRGRVGDGVRSVHVVFHVVVVVIGVRVIAIRPIEPRARCEGRGERGGHGHRAPAVRGRAIFSFPSYILPRFLALLAHDRRSSPIRRSVSYARRRLAAEPPVIAPLGRRRLGRRGAELALQDFLAEGARGGAEGGGCAAEKKGDQRFIQR
ncbi:hypothetical protein C8R47DRAFT_744143 [Mycena vitilis]|nr:hypothetical protein C8R47DRAFT_744143 [Mycena vitilis]